MPLSTMVILCVYLFLLITFTFQVVSRKYVVGKLFHSLHEDVLGVPVK